MGIGQVNRYSAKAVFLDRDGVLNVPIVRNGKPYPPENPADLSIIEGVPEALELLKQSGFVLIVVTNQPDVARGKIRQSIVEAINEKLMNTVTLDDIRICYHDDTDYCHCRKPLPGMLLDAAEEHNIDLAKSYLVGDRWRDIDAGFAAGVKTVFIDYGYNEQQPEHIPNFTGKSLLEAAHWIISH